jgi:hypothetical protein
MKKNKWLSPKGSGLINAHVEGPINKGVVEIIKKRNPGKTIRINGKKY